MKLGTLFCMTDWSLAITRFGTLPQFTNSICYNAELPARGVLGISHLAGVRVDVGIFKLLIARKQVFIFSDDGCPEDFFLLMIGVSIGTL